MQDSPPPIPSQKAKTWNNRRNSPENLRKIRRFKFIQMAIPKHLVVTVDEAGLDGVSTELLYGYSDMVRSIDMLAPRYGPPSL